MTRIWAAALLLALAARAEAPEPFFDGSARAALTLPPPPAAPLGKPLPPPVPPEIAAAAGRVGHAAMLGRLAAEPARARFSFGVIGDAEPGRFVWERIFNPGKNAFMDQWRALQPSVDFTLQLGDFVSVGNAASYLRYAAILESGASKPILHCVGNHDRSRPNGDANKVLYDALFGPRDYWFDHGGWRFVSLDSSDRRVSAAQLAWLRAALAAPGPKLVFTHVPPAYLRTVVPLPALRAALERGSARPGSRARRQSAVGDFFNNYFDDGAREFEEIVGAGGVKAVYMGHIHALWAADHRGVRYVISGGGGSPLYPLPPGFPSRRLAHTLRVSAGPDGLVETVVPYQGTPFVLPPPGY